MSGTDPIIKITDLHFRYKKAAQPVFAGLNLTVKAGERLTVLGPSEAANPPWPSVSRASSPGSSRASFRAGWRWPASIPKTARPRELAGRVGLLFQDFEAQLFCTRVDQEVAFGPENLGLPREELKRRVARSLALVGLTGLEARDPATLSGGQRQLLALAAVLALEPQLLVLDEPTSDLDPFGWRNCSRPWTGWPGSRSLTLVLLGQDLRLARNCSRLVLFNQGAGAGRRPARAGAAAGGAFPPIGPAGPGVARPVS